MNYNEEENPALEEDKILDEIEETEEDETVEFEDDDDSFEDDIEVTVSDFPEEEEENKDEVVEPKVSGKDELLDSPEEDKVEEPKVEIPSAPKKGSKVLSYEEFIKNI